jgi:hypothetical protein
VNQCSINSFISLAYPFITSPPTHAFGLRKFRIPPISKSGFPVEYFLHSFGISICSGSPIEVSNEIPKLLILRSFRSSSENVMSFSSLLLSFIHCCCFLFLHYWYLFLHCCCYHFHYGCYLFLHFSLQYVNR